MTSTLHMFYSECDPTLKSLFDSKSKELCPEGFEPVTGMDEYYVSSMNPQGSDKVFETAHVDGPFGALPFTLLRCVYVIQPNDRVMTTICKEGSMILKKDEHVFFDYNRDVHYITYLDGNDTTDRIVLKLHFVRKQKYYKIFTKANVLWNTFARYIFVYSKTPETMFQNMLANIINGTTKLYVNFFRK